MNPPSAIQSAMGRERKPFTYTPGGLDLSEIKSQRMAQRLMRNAMNQGVAEVPAQSPHPAPTTHIAVPNYNCLPVQVFPTIQLPSNPKSLLRTRSHPAQPNQRSEPIMPSFLNPKTNIVNSPPAANKPMFTYSNNQNLSRTQSLNEYENDNPFEIKSPSRTNTSSDSYSFPTRNFNHEVDYFRIPEMSESVVSSVSDTDRKYHDTGLFTSYPAVNCMPKITTAYDQVPVTSPFVSSPPLIEENNNEQKDVRIVKKKATNKEQTIQNGNHNGDTEAAVTVKLPSRASAAKTETKVEVVQKTLPDGSLQEIKTTITKTTVDGKTEIATRTETKTIPKAVEFEEEEEEEVEESEEEVEEPQVVEQSTKKETKEEVVEETIENNDSNNKSNLIVNEERSETTTTTAKKVVIVENSKEEESKEDSEEEIEEEIIEASGEVENKENEKVNKNEMQEEEEVVVKQSTEEIVDAEESQVEESQLEESHIEDTQDDIEEEEAVEEPKADNKESPIREEEIKKEVEEEKVTIQSDHDESEYTEEEYESEVEEAPKVESKTTQVEVEEDEKISKNNLVKEENDTIENESQEEEKEVIETAEVENNEDLETEKENAPEPQEVSEEKVELEEKPGTVEVKNDETKSPKEEVQIPVKVDTPEETHRDEVVKEIKVEVKVEENENKSTPAEYRIPIREPSVPFEKVEDVEIRPITGQDFVTKSHTETTEITTSSDAKPTGGLSTQTEYNRVENIVTVNRLTKTLDKQFENYVQPTTIPSLSSYFSQTRDISPARQIPRPVQQPAYTPSEPVTERRHSLLLERLSVERQLPVTEIYQNQYNTHISEQQRQWSEEPRSEVLTVGNVKPSTITKNQQWYQYSQKDNVSSNMAAPTTPVTPSQQPWSPPQQQTHPQYQQQYQPRPQPQIQPQSQPHSQLQPQPTFQPPIHTDQTYKSSYSENIIQDSSRNSSNIYSSNSQQNSYSHYAPPKSDYASKQEWSSNVPIVNQSSNYSSQYSTNTDYNSQSAQAFPSSYVPPPWEQDSKYVPPTNQTPYQPPPAATFSPSFNQPWQPEQKPKPTKPPTSYIPPAPNQSFVKPVTPTPPKASGRKTYYSEYERRYISVPESNYVPTETKYQHQPDPSPVYYYNTEEPPSEPTEPEWRKELREFTEKSKTQTYTEQTSSVKPPWQETSAKPPLSSYTPTPTWSQTLRPRSYRERSYEAEFTGSQTQEWPKVNTMGRSRPVSTYEKNDYESPAQRVRGVSVDRYNPRDYQSPAPGEHPPVLSQTLTPQNAPHKNHPHVPAYNSRASAEPRDQPSSYKQPRVVDSRAPFQSRSFKYLQWITGTED